MSTTEIPITRATRGDWEALREIRLRALADSPDAFGATLERDRAHPPELWQERLAAPSPTWLAWDGDRPVAMGGCFLVPDSRTTMVWGMWTDPDHRGRGLGRRILEAAVTFSHQVGRTAYLDVAEGNDAARALYASAGFEPTGEWSPLRGGSPVRVEEMVLRRG